MLHQGAHTPYSRPSLLTGLQEGCTSRATCSARRNSNNSVCAGTRDVTSVTGAAVYANGRIQSQAVAWTVEAPLNTEWACASVSHQHHRIPHIVPLHDQQTDIHMQLSHGPPLGICNANMPSVQQESCKNEGQHQTQDITGMQCNSHVQQSQQPQQAGVLGCMPVDSQALTAAVDLQQPAELQQRICSLRQWTQQEVCQKCPVQRPGRNQQQRLVEQQHQVMLLTGSVVSPDAGPLLLRVANSTSADGLAEQLVNRLQQQLRLHQRQHQHTSKQGLPGTQQSSGSRISMVLQCSSGASLYNALQAISLAAQQAACLPQPQQLLLQPQLIRNVLDTAADGKHGAGAYQLLLLWIPYCTINRGMVGIQRQPQQQCKNTLMAQRHRQHVDQQNQRHPSLKQMQPAELHGHPLPGLTAATAAAPAVSGTRAGTQRSHQLQCDVPAAAACEQSKSQRKQKNTAASSRQQSSSSKSNKPGRQLLVQSISWRVSGLLRGGWPVELSCCSPAGALVAVKAVVSARKQLAAGGMDLLVAVQTTAAGVARASAVEVPIVLTVAGFPVQQSIADAGARFSTARSSRQLAGRQAEFVKTSSAEQYLRQQHREQRKHRQLLNKTHHHHQQQPPSPLQDTSSTYKGRQGQEGQQQQVQQQTTTAETAASSMQKQQQWLSSFPNTPVGNSAHQIFPAALKRCSDSHGQQQQQQRHLLVAFNAQQQQHTSAGQQQQKQGQPRLQDHHKQQQQQQKPAFCVALSQVPAAAAKSMVVAEQHCL